MICQCMIQAFMYGWANDSYGLSDVEVGRQYAEDLMKYERRKREPFHHYDLRTFIGWCDKEIERLKEELKRR